jgi:hypothetical protein
MLNAFHHPACFSIDRHHWTALQSVTCQSIWSKDYNVIIEQKTWIYYLIENWLMTGRSISSPTCSRSLKPSMSGMFTSLITISYPSFLSRSKLRACLAKQHVVTETNNKIESECLTEDVFSFQKELESYNLTEQQAAYHALLLLLLVSNCWALAFPDHRCHLWSRDTPQIRRVPVSDTHQCLCL